MSEVFQTIPLFSPSQMSCNDENVLRSVFSPSFGGLAIAQLEDTIKRGTAVETISEAPFEPCRDELRRDEKDVKRRTPACRNGCYPRSVTFQSDTFCRKKRDGKNIDPTNDMEFPANELHLDDILSPGLAMSPITVADECSRSQDRSTKSSRTSSSWNNIPVEMLDIEFVANCNSPEELDRIVKALVDASPTKYPSLLRMAKARLETLQSTAASRTQSHSGRRILKREAELGFNITRSGIESHMGIMVVNTAPSMIGDEQASENITSVLPGSRKSPANASGRKYTPDGARNRTIIRSTKSTLVKDQRPDANEPAYLELKENLASVLAAHSLLSDELDKALLERDHVQNELNKYKMCCRDLESKLKEQKEELHFEIASLEHARDKAETEKATLEGTLVSSSAEARGIESRLAARTEEVNALRTKLHETRNKAEREIASHQSLYQQLRAKINFLTAQLSHQEERAAHKLDMLEKEMKRDFEVASEEQLAQIAELKAKLTEARSDVARLEKKNVELSTCIQRDGNKKECLSGDDDFLQKYNKMVAELKRHETEASSMADALALSKSALVEAEESRNECELKIAKLKKRNSSLAVENKELSQLLDEVSRELASSDVYIDHLLDEIDVLAEGSSDAIIKTRDEMQVKEKLFLSKIRQLESTIKEQESWVSMETYQKAVKEAKGLAKLRCVLESEIKKLSIKNHRLESEVEKYGKREMPCIHGGKGVESDLLSSGRGACRSVEVSKEKSFIKHEDDQPISKKSSPQSANLSGKNLTRVSAVRAAGGRAALSAKLKKSRETALRNNHQDHGQATNCQSKVSATKAATSIGSTGQDNENFHYYR